MKPEPRPDAPEDCTRFTVLVHDADNRDRIVGVIEIPNGTLEVTPVDWNSSLDPSASKAVAPATLRYDVDIRAYRQAEPDRHEFVVMRTGVESVPRDLIALAVASGGEAAEHDAVMSAAIDGDVWNWLNYGYEHGWCTRPVCDTHDGVPLTDAEQDEFDEQGDPCVPLVRLWNEHDKLPEAWT